MELEGANADECIAEPQPKRRRVKQTVELPTPQVVEEIIRVEEVRGPWIRATSRTVEPIVEVPGPQIVGNAIEAPKMKAMNVWKTVQMMKAMKAPW